MYQSIHIHTPRCKHASGSEEEYVLAAIAAGMTDIGFSDHTPLPAAYVSTRPEVYAVRMDVTELQDYAESIKALRKKFNGQINIRFGMETEYVPSIHNEVMDILRGVGIEYNVLGQHFLRDGDYFTLTPTDDEDLLTEYVDTVLEAAATGDFDIAAHPDLINFTGDKTKYEREMLRLAKGLKAVDIPVEINLHGLASDRNYPNKIFWNIVSAVGNRTIISSDAHKISEIWDEQLYKKGLAFAADCGIKVLDGVL